VSAIIFHWDTPKGLDTPHGKKKLLSRWNLTAKAFGITNLSCITSEDIVMNDTEVNFRTFKTLHDAIENSINTLVYVEQGGIDYKHFKYPENATYIFGSDYESLQHSDISIPSLLPVHAETAAGIILAHRYSQWH